MNNETALVGSPSFKYVATVNAELLDEVTSDFTRQVVKEVCFSFEGDAIYSISSDEREYRASDVLVTVIRMSTHEILAKKTFTCQFLSLVPMKHGVVTCLKDQEPTLWNFELTECIRSFTGVKGTKKLVLLSDELIACQLSFRTLTPDEIRSDLVERLYLSEVDDFFEPTVDDSVELDYSQDFDDSSNGDDSSVLDNCSGSEIFLDYDTRISAMFKSYRMLAVDIINATIGECISSVKTKIRLGNNDVVFISCNSQNQLLVCIREEIRNYFGEEELTVSLRRSNVLKCLWQRSTKRFEGEIRITPGFIFSPEEKFVATLNTFDSSYGIHILDAKTGETCNTLLKDHKVITDCKFVANRETLVCCSRGNFLRLINIRSGDLLSVLDVEERPYCVGACLGKPLVAIGLSGSRLKFIHVECRKGRTLTRRKVRFDFI